MTDVELELKNAEAISRAHDRQLDPPEEGKLCTHCSGTGVLPGTETEHLFGDPCPEGCRLDLQRIRDQGRG